MSRFANLNDEEYNFSEEEEQLYVAEHLSDDENDAKETAVDLHLSNVTVFRSSLVERTHGSSMDDMLSSRSATLPDQKISQDERILILFDLNGVLVHHKFNGKTHRHYLRPGVHHLLRLMRHYRLGIYSSATLRTVQRAIAKLNQDVKAAADVMTNRGGRSSSFPKGGLFDVILCRDHCVLAKDVGAARAGGKPWDTVKPLGRYFTDLSRIILVDDSPHKSLPDEVANMLVVPAWSGPEIGWSDDGVIQTVVESLLQAMKSMHIQDTIDIRSLIMDLNKKLEDKVRAVGGERTSLVSVPPLSDADVHDPRRYLYSSSQKQNPPENKKQEAGQSQILSFFEDRGVPSADDAPEFIFLAEEGRGGKKQGGQDQLNDTKQELADAPASKLRYLQKMAVSLGLAADSGLSKKELRRKNIELFKKEKAESKKDARGEEDDVQTVTDLTVPHPDLVGYYLRSCDRPTAKRNNNVLSSLHDEITQFARDAAPTRMEVAEILAAVRAVDIAARAVWKQAEVLMFGSQATGLALPGNDLDIVVLNVGPQLKRAATGFNLKERRSLTNLLHQLMGSLRRTGAALEKAQVIAARIPILKCMMRFQGGNGNGNVLPVDISFGAVNGAAAVEFIRRQVIAVPPLRPLALAVKAFLRDRGLNEVFTGGLGSYAVVNLVLAHLQTHGYTADSSSSAGARDKSSTMHGTICNERSTFDFLDSLTSGYVDHKNTPIDSDLLIDLGALLWGFFDLFGDRFDYDRRAVSVRRGGFIKKGAWHRPQKPWLLAVEDPQEPGKDICGGSFNVQKVQGEFRAAAHIVAEACEEVEASQGIALRETVNAVFKPTAAMDVETYASGCVAQHGNSILGLLMDLQAAVGRGKAARAARAALEVRCVEARAVQLSRKRPASGGGDGSSPTPPSKRIKKPRHRTSDGGELGGGGSSGSRSTKRAKALVPSGKGKARGLVPSGKGKARGNKRSRAVEAQWHDRRGQYFE